MVVKHGFFSQCTLAVYLFGRKKNTHTLLRNMAKDQSISNICFPRKGKHVIRGFSQMSQ